MRQVRVEEQKFGAIDPELCPNDGASSIIIPQDAHMTNATVHQCYLVGVVKHIVPAVTVDQSVPRSLRQSMLILALLCAHDCCIHFTNLVCKIRNSAVRVASVLGVVTHDR